MCVNKLKYCRICKRENLPVVVDLGVQGLSGVFPKIGEPDPIAAPLCLVQCQDCGLVQLGHSIEPNLLYGDTYGYRSGINKTMRDHLKSIIMPLEKQIKLSDGDVVLDIGSNDSTLLNYYSNDKLNRIGYDPSGEKFRKYYSKGTTLFTTFFDKDSFLKSTGGRKAKIITSIAMLYDLEDPLSFISDVKSILDRDGVWVTEQSYMPLMVEKNMFDTICHEHLEYYGITRLACMLVANDLRIFSLLFNGVNGGSVQLHICHKDASYPKMTHTLNMLIEKEKEERYNTVEPFVRFNRRINRIKKNIVAFVNSEIDMGKTFHLLGASTKGNVLLQYYGLDHNHIKYASERNPMKHGCHTPVTHIPIISEKESRELNPDFYLVLPWHFKDEIVEREKEYLEQGGKLVFPLPEFEVIGSCK